MKVRCLEDLEKIASTKKNILTLFSGGLDSSYILYLLRNSTANVYALAVDVGDDINKETLSKITHYFNVELIVIEAKERFLSNAVLPALQAKAKYMGLYPISASLSRPIIASYAVEQAALLNSDVIIHSANQSQNSLRRLNGAIEQLGFNGYYGSPYEYSAITREKKIKDLDAIGLGSFKSRGISGDSNLWCREFESGLLENPEAFDIPLDVYKWIRKPPLTTEQVITISYKNGIPTALNNKTLDVLSLINQLNNIAGAAGIGQFCGLEHLDQGEKVLEIREAPAASLLMDAYQHLEMASLDAELLREKIHIEQLWVREAVEGRWYGPLKAASEAFISNIAQYINGSVSYRLANGTSQVTSIIASKPLYLKERDHWELLTAHQRSLRHLEL